MRSTPSSRISGAPRSANRKQAFSTLPAARIFRVVASRACMELRDIVCKLFSYDQSSGLFIRKIKRGQAFKPGQIAGTISKKDGYVRIVIGAKAYLAHRLAWLVVHGTLPDREIDHRNGVRHDNRIGNLRLATELENSCNKLLAKNNKSGFKGASFAKRHKKWAARIQVSRKCHFLGLFDTPEEAHAAYVIAAARLHGEYANDGRRAITSTCPISLQPHEHVGLELSLSPPL